MASSGRAGTPSLRTPTTSSGPRSARATAERHGHATAREREDGGAGRDRGDDDAREEAARLPPVGESRHDGSRRRAAARTERLRQ